MPTLAVRLNMGGNKTLLSQAPALFARHSGPHVLIGSNP
jgi:hypothetical protein